MTCTRPRAENQKSLDPWVPYTAGAPLIAPIGPVSFERVTRPGARHANHSSRKCSREHQKKSR
jgi:hypothetical protein